jgi:hypothetical protein
LRPSPLTAQWLHHHGLFYSGTAGRLTADRVSRSCAAVSRPRFFNVTYSTALRRLPLRPWKSLTTLFRAFGEIMTSVTLSVPLLALLFTRVRWQLMRSLAGVTAR